MSRNTVRPALAIAAALLAGAAGCGGGSDNNSSSSTSATPAAPSTTTTTRTTATTGAAGGGAAVAAKGKAVFQANGCGSCHTLAAAGSSGTVGPDLGQVLKGKDAAFIHESIVDPNKQIAKGYQPGIMPTTFGTQISKADLAALVAFLRQSAGS